MRRFFPIALFLLAISMCAAAQTRAVVEFSVATLHRGADYESPVESQCLMGSSLLVSDQDSYWRKVSAMEPPYQGWTEELSLVEMTQEQYEAYLAAPKYVCTAVITHIFADPSAESPFVSDITMGGVVRKALDARGRAVRKGRWLQVLLPSGRSGWMRRSELQDHAQWLAGRTATAENVIGTAKKFLGSPYMWGGNSTKGVDCSGLTWMAFHMNGIELPRDTSQQVKEGREVSLEQMVPGDLIFFGTPASGDSRERVSHVAIYLGDGMILHSSQVVRISSLDPDSPDYYQHRPILHVRRILD
ncbi:MAG: C40 family peptidase [Bacteroidales bacterium]|nr:C40 family peptidase [Bacteroidales bacterium]